MATPKLRFKGFYEKWQLTQLKDKADFLAGYAFSSKLMSNNICQYQLIKMSNIYKNKLDINRNPSYWQSINKKTEKYLLSKGDIVLTLTGTVGKKDYGYSVEINKNDKYLLNQRLVRIKGKEEESTSKFLHYRVSTSIFYYHFFNAAKGGTGNQANVSVEDIKLIKILFPSIKEQTKIATFLSAVDTKIDELIQKHELLTEYKKGMMQQIFSQKLRFKADDGSDFEDWDDITLGEISSKSLAKNKDESISEVLTNSATQGVIKQSDYFERDIVTTSNLKGYYVVEIGDFVYNPRISSQAPVGPIKRNKQCLGVMSPLYTVFTTNKGDINYLEYFFESSIWHDYVKSVSNSGARHDRMNIKNQDFFDMPILYPCLAEQTKIANFLTAIDQKIDNVAEQIDHAKTWKKGLLQQMFV
uniref:restriction endonuclease subunit S n=1 Tax=uncultured Psychrobacter sp. TaxID=259303 RepID=UPI00259687DA|nr:restriction endonuclease subunit S [uncultured Psychrobacter sp.]